MNDQELDKRIVALLTAIDRMEQQLQRIETNTRKGVKSVKAK